MSRKFMLSLCAVALVAASAWAQTADELIEKNIKAKGGMEKMKAVHSIKFTGKMKMGPMEAPLTLQKLRPASARIEFTLQGMTGIQAYDGTTGWMVMPFMGKTEPEKMSEDMLKDFKEMADFDGPTVDYKAKGNKVEYLGKVDVEGTAAYKLKVTTKDGLETVEYLDADNYLEIKTEGKRKVQGQEIEDETTFGDYKSVDGMMFPFSIETRAKGKEGSQGITIEKVELNSSSVVPANFTMPEPKKAEPAAEPKKN